MRIIRRGDDPEGRQEGGGAGAGSDPPPREESAAAPGGEDAEPRGEAPAPEPQAPEPQAEPGEAAPVSEDEAPEPGDGAGGVGNGTQPPSAPPHGGGAAAGAGGAFAAVRRTVPDVVDEGEEIDPVELVERLRGKMDISATGAIEAVLALEDEGGLEARIHGWRKVYVLPEGGAAALRRPMPGAEAAEVEPSAAPGREGRLARLRPGARPEPATRAARVRRMLAHVLMVFGGLALVEGAVTTIWEEPVTSVYTAFVQGGLEEDFDALRKGERAAQQLQSAREASRYIERRAKTLTATAQPGQAIGEVKAETIGLDSVMVQGTASEIVRKGPAHYSETPLPGLKGDWTAGIAGHRTTYSAPFRDLDDLAPGDRVTVTMPYARFVYSVEGTDIVEPAFGAAFQKVGYDRLALTACHPRYSDAKRIIAYARLQRTEPLGAAKRSGGV